MYFGNLDEIGTDTLEYVILLAMCYAVLEVKV